ncbi:glycosyltransferase family 2 protein [Bordetella avium]|uniref:Lipopolysaccharide core biosynthesis glycosyl transferase n=1 Tax=Bordetella avium (strain 197N) TaxID=360910 RepID=Q2KYR6_BORA1|nr:glycosyltransferase family 2 protein [Bordetella avium]RIQ17762.1 glycosyltransferase family 2 protein [Bordetella avium]RIQ32419.1 glycosyltransferase family 2 protein [Bordetella avium]RIQ51119.1 glycosyltransferase family 2 protein [Bordetella avium]RIQ68801.1 glycosyltransferase family 2 protein [Bordetella avium]CAJ49846.1 lipopolysaccharide core biosynthesis glycosyl transferase [Bordetella avium 197N]
MTLSVIIITKNEAANIRGCLESVAFADEFIVVDSGSTDNTVELARDFGARVSITPDWPGFGVQKNRALDLATGDWVLSIDADERLTPELAQAIRTAMASPQATAYEMPRLSWFCGRFIRHSGWWPDYVLRLWKRGTARFTDAAVHERVVPHDGQVLRLAPHLEHYPYPDLDTLVTKANRYSSDAAAMMYAKGRRANIFTALGHSFWTFVRIYLIRRGFLDGRHGLVLAVTAAAGSFFRYAKLMFKSEPEPPK